MPYEYSPGFSNLFGASSQPLAAKRKQLPIEYSAACGGVVYFVVLSGFVWLTFILGLALAEEVTIYDKEWQVKERIQDGTIYDRNWRVKGHIEDGRIYDRDWNLEKRIEDGKVYDRNWNLEKRIDKDRIYDKNWNLKGYIKRGK